MIMHYITKDPTDRLEENVVLSNNLDLVDDETEDSSDIVHLFVTNYRSAITRNHHRNCMLKYIPYQSYPMQFKNLWSSQHSEFKNTSSYILEHRRAYAVQIGSAYLGENRSKHFRFHETFVLSVLLDSGSMRYSQVVWLLKSKNLKENSFSLLYCFISSRQVIYGSSLDYKPHHH